MKLVPDRTEDQDHTCKTFTISVSPLFWLRGGAVRHEGSLHFLMHFLYSQSLSRRKCITLKFCTASTAVCVCVRQYVYCTAQ